MSGTTVNIELTGVAAGASRVQRITRRLPIVAITWILTSRTKSIDASGWLDAFRSNRAVGIELAGLRMKCKTESADECGETSDFHLSSPYGNGKYAAPRSM